MVWHWEFLFFFFLLNITVYVPPTLHEAHTHTVGRTSKQVKFQSRMKRKLTGSIYVIKTPSRGFQKGATRYVGILEIATLQVSMR